MTQKTKVAAYARVSTDMADQLHSLASQIQYFTDHISQHEGWELVEVYYDEGITGTSVKKRDGFNRMIADCEKGKIDTILTKEVSRFARNTVDTLNYTRHLKQLKVNVIFTNDGINTDDKDGELRLTIMASIAQEESRKISERVKWGMKRKMENGYVYGYSHIFGYHLHNGVLELIPEEAEVIKRIFHEYVFDEKSGAEIADGLNADGIKTAKGGAWRKDGVFRIMKNDKYCGDLIQWKQCSTDFLTKKLIVNTGENPDTPVITVFDHHEPIVSREVFEAANRIMDERGKKSREGKRFSCTYWFSNKVVCGRCGTNYSKSGSKKTSMIFLRCSNRAAYGKEKLIGYNGREVGCDNGFLSEKLLITTVQYVIKQIQDEREAIIQQLMENVQCIQNMSAQEDTSQIQEQIDKLNEKKHNAVDLMLEGIISKDDLKQQVELYDKKIEQLTQKISECENINVIQQKQIDGIKAYIDQINETSQLETFNKDVYRAIVKKIIFYGTNTIDIYLNCVPFGFRLTYRKEKVPHSQAYNFIIENCDTI